jgi:hypothetical protein
MKLIPSLILAVLVTLPVCAAPGHKHAAGPNGGRILETTPFHTEFFVQPDRRIRLTFLDEAMKPAAAGAQEAKAIAEAKTGKVSLEFEKNGDALVSKTALPEGDGYRIVVQIKPESGAKPQNFRVDYLTHVCGGCKLAEYACICDHASGGGHGH